MDLNPAKIARIHLETALTLLTAFGRRAIPDAMWHIREAAKLGAR